MIQLDSDSTYGSTVSVNLGRLETRVRPFPERSDTRHRHFRSRPTSTGDNRA
jgi:hypothetical protein